VGAEAGNGGTNAPMRGRYATFAAGSPMLDSSRLATRPRTWVFAQADHLPEGVGGRDIRHCGDQMWEADVD
jgi:hypothetical protein